MQESGRNHFGTHEGKIRRNILLDIDTDITASTENLNACGPVGTVNLYSKKKKKKKKNQIRNK